MKNVKQKIIAGALVVCSLLLIEVGYIILFHPNILDICLQYFSNSCDKTYVVSGIGDPLYYGIRSLPVLFLVVFFVRWDVFQLWWKFALPFTLFIFWFVIGVSPEGGGGFMSYWRSEYTRFFSLWLTSSSLILIAFKTFRPHWHTYFTIPAALLLSFAGLLLVLT